MLKEAIEKIQELSQGKIFEVGSEHFSDVRLNRIEELEYRPSSIKLASLESLVELVKGEAAVAFDRTLFVEVTSPTQVSVYTTYDNKYKRDYLYTAIADTVSTPVDHWTDKDSLLISLNSVFIPGGDVDYIQGVLQKVSEESKVSSTDNGLGQSIEAQRGISLKENLNLKKRVKLAPFRTFLEVEQPESEFILRAREGGEFLIKSADGGAWELDAKRNIKNHLIAAFENAEAYNKGKIVVMA